MLDRKLFAPFVPLEVLEDALAQRATAFHDETVTADRLMLDPRTGNLVVRNGHFLEHPLQDQAVTLLANRLRIPGEYLRRCPPDLRAENVNHWLATLKEKSLLVRFDGEEVRAILTDRYTPVDNLDLVRTLRTGSNDLEARFEWTPTRFVAQVVSPRYEAMVKGDRFLGGVNLTNSEVGFASVGIDALFLRLICTNGMVVTETEVGVKRVHRSNTDRLHRAIREAIGNVTTVLPRLTSHVEQAVEEEVDLTKDQVRNALADAGLSEGVKEAVIQRIPTDPNERRTRFALVNAVTAVANRPAWTLADREALQRLGGRLLVGTAR